MVELLRIFKCLLQTSAVLDVAGVVAYPGVEDVVERVTTEKQVAYNPQTLAIRFICPQSSQVSNSINSLLLRSNHCLEAAKRNLVLLKQRPNFLLILFNKWNNPFTEVFWDIFRFIFKPSLIFAFLFAQFLTLGGLKILALFRGERNLRDFLARVLFKTSVNNVFPVLYLGVTGVVTVEGEVGLFVGCMDVVGVEVLQKRGL